MSEQRSPDDERVIAYLRSRAATRVPDDLVSKAVANPPRRRIGSRIGVAGLAAAAAVALVMVLVVVIGGAVLLGPVPTGTAVGSVTQSAAPTDTPGIGPTPSARDELAGLPVLTVAQAVDLLQAGKLDGRAVAVRGHWFQAALPCPSPLGYIGPLEEWCRASYFTDDDLPMYHCDPSGGCSFGDPTAVPHLKPFDVTETSLATDVIWNNATQVVMVGHAGDPRQWQCTTVTQSQCARAFVMDAIVPADAASIAVTPPETGVSAQLSLANVEQAAGIAPESVLNAVALPASQAAEIDPRLKFATNDTVWIVHSLAAGLNGDPTRAVVVTVVDDASASVLSTRDLAMATDYEPARIWVQATKPQQLTVGYDYPFYSVVDQNSSVLQSAMIGGGSRGGANSMTYGPGTPIVVDAGTYGVSAWLSAIRQTDYYPVATGAPIGTCSTTVTVGPLDDLHLQASFPADGNCTFGPAPTDTPLP